MEDTTQQPQTTSTATSPANAIPTHDQRVTELEPPTTAMMGGFRQTSVGLTEMTEPYPSTSNMSSTGYEMDSGIYIPTGAKSLVIGEN